MMRYSWTLCLLCLILPACLYHPQARLYNVRKGYSRNLESSQSTGVNSPISDSDFHNEDYRLRALSYEAKLPDIPIPVASDPIPDFFIERESTQGMVLGYVTGNDLEQLATFFKTEFAQLGWKIVAESHHIESLLIVEKPDRVCTVSLRALDDCNVFIVTICQKD